MKSGESTAPVVYYSTMDKFFELLGFTTPFIYAAATYGLFAWLDENASSEAKIALAGMLKLKPVNREAIASAVTEAFDRLYTRPLLSWRAVFRSMMLTLVVTALFLFERRYTITKLDVDNITLFVIGIAINVLSDYLALFVIRAWLPLFRGRGLEALVGGPLSASIGVLLIGIAMRMGAAGVLLQYKGITVFDPRNLGLVTFELAIPAIVVFAWLPLFALGIAAVRARNALSTAVGQTQLFLKEGSEHPLKAVGLVAAVVVFIVAAVSPLAIRFLAYHSGPPVE